MDRIYTSKDSDVNKFKKYANENEVAMDQDLLNVKDVMRME